GVTRRVFTLLAVEPGVEQNCLAAPERCGWRKLHLRGCKQESSDALWIVRPDLLVGVVVIAAVAVGIAAESSAINTVGELQPAIGAGLDETFHYAVIGARGSLLIFGIEIAEAHAFRERVSKHAGSRRFEVVARCFGLVHHLIPEASLRILDFSNGRCEPVEN